MLFLNSKSYFIVLTLIICGFVNGCKGDPPLPQHILQSQGGNKVVVMDFSRKIQLDPIQPGWKHSTFFWHKPMNIEFVTKDNIPAIKLSTHDTASILIRYVDIKLKDYPRLSWQWYIEQPIDSPIDEKTKEGDDHPARFFIGFETNSGEKRHMEIIWGNRLKSGEYKYIEEFPHYVARGGNENIKQWFHEEINLQEIYQRIWSDQTPVRVIEIGLFCDSDDTDTQSVSYFANVVMQK